MAATLPQYRTVQDLAKELGLQVNQAKNLVTTYSMVEGMICPRGSNNDLLIPHDAFEDIVTLHRQSKEEDTFYVTLLTIRQAARRQQIEQQTLALQEAVDKAMALLSTTANNLQVEAEKARNLHADLRLTAASLTILGEGAKVIRENQDRSRELLVAAQKVNDKATQHWTTAELVSRQLERYRKLLHQDYRGSSRSSAFSRASHSATPSVRSALTTATPARVNAPEGMQQVSIQTCDVPLTRPAPELTTSRLVPQMQGGHLEDDADLGDGLMLRMVRWAKRWWQ